MSILRALMFSMSGRVQGESARTHVIMQCEGSTPLYAQRMPVPCKMEQQKIEEEHTSVNACPADSELCSKLSSLWIEFVQLKMQIRKTTNGTPHRSLQLKFVNPTSQNHDCDDVSELIRGLGGVTAATGVRWALRLAPCLLRHVREWQCVEF